MKTLILQRHAKAEKDGDDDLCRPLTPGGLSDAASQGETIRQMEFRLILAAENYEKQPDGTYLDLSQTAEGREKLYTDENIGFTLKVVGIIRPREGVSATSISGALGYTKELTELILQMNAESEVINQQKQTPDYNVLTGLKFERTVYTRETIGQLIRTIDESTMSAIYSMMTAQVKDIYTKNPPVTDMTSFLGFVNFMSYEEQAMLLGQMLPIAQQVDPTGVSTLCMVTTFYS